MYLRFRQLTCRKSTPGKSFSLFQKRFITVRSSEIGIKFQTCFSAVCIYKPSGLDVIVFLPLVKLFCRYLNSCVCISRKIIHCLKKKLQNCSMALVLILSKESNNHFAQHALGTILNLNLLETKFNQIMYMYIHVLYGSKDRTQANTERHNAHTHEKKRNKTKKLVFQGTPSLRQAQKTHTTKYFRTNLLVYIFKSKTQNGIKYYTLLNVSCSILKER